MDELLRLFDEYGVAGLCVVVFAKRMGIPLPALPLLLLAGARGAHDPAFAANAVWAACVAAVAADTLWFFAGRRFGMGMLALMCRISLSPDTCVRRSELVFAERGAVTVLLAKFIPGVAGLAPPLAGAFGMSAREFTKLNLAGTLLWAGAGVAAGLALNRQVMQVVAAVVGLGGLALPLVLAGIVAYLLWLFVRRSLASMANLRSPRLAPQDVADRIARGERIVLVDVRVPLFRERIQGALHSPADGIRSNELLDGAQGAPLVVYCDCPGDVSAVRAARMLDKRGSPVHVLAGGFPAWRAAGLPVEPAQPGRPAASDFGERIESAV